MAVAKRTAFLSLSAFGLLSLCAVPAARADMTMTITEVGGNVVGTGSGTLNLTGLTFKGNVSGGGLVEGTFPSGGSAIGLGAPVPQTVSGYAGTLTGSSISFGSGPLFVPNSGSGNPVDLSPGNTFAQIFVPVGYVSGSALADTSTWDSTTIAALGLTPGTYVYDWGTGATADSFTLIIGAPAATPEPGSFLLLGSGLLGMVGVARRRLS